MAKDGANGFNQAVKQGVTQLSTSLSTLFGTKINPTKISTQKFSSRDISKNVGGASENLVVVSFKLQDGKSNLGNMLLVYPQDIGFMFADLLNQKKVGTSKALDDLGKEALKEASNIATGTFLSAIAAAKGRRSIQSVPRIFTANGDSVTDFLFLGSAKKDGVALSVEVGFTLPKLKKTGKFYFLIDIDSLGVLVQKEEKTKIISKAKKITKKKLPSSLTFLQIGL
jgi:chemotaxis protein CheY-P-specific phosphatase CheC